MAVKISVADVRIGWTEQQLALGNGPLLVKLATNPRNFYSLGPNDPVGPLFARIVQDVGSDRIEMLSIFSHGYVVKDSRNALHGGYGVQFGKDDILVQNAEALFAGFKGKCPSGTVGIELVGCEVAARSRVQNGASVEVGDGIALCTQIAKGADTCVRASPASQIFATVAEFSKIVSDPTKPLGRGSQTGNVVDPGIWEGNVWVICKNGRR